MKFLFLLWVLVIERTETNQGMLRSDHFRPERRAREHA